MTTSSTLTKQAKNKPKNPTAGTGQVCPLKTLCVCYQFVKVYEFQMMSLII